MNAILCTVLLAGTLALVDTAAAEKRVALVIGNSRYENVPQLPNPANDSEDVAVALASIGFEVQRINDSSKAEMEDALADFSDEALGADIAIVFYAGHGIEVDRQNYLIPIDAKLETDRRLLFETVSLDYVMAALDAVRGVRIVLLDACRNNPFAASMKATGATRSIGRGLSRIEAPDGTLVSFAASEGAVAEDGDGRNSPFASALLATLSEPIEIGLLFRRVRDSVMSATGGRQVPYVSASLPSEPIYLLPPSAMLSLSRPAEISEPSAETVLRAASEAWPDIRETNSIPTLEAFIAQFDGTFFAVLAKERLGELEHQDASSDPAETQAPEVSTPEAKESELQLVRGRWREIQVALNSLGFDSGIADGVVGTQTRTAIRSFQQSQGLPISGYASTTLLAALDRAREDIANIQFGCRTSETASTDQRCTVGPKGPVLMADGEIPVRLLSVAGDVATMDIYNRPEPFRFRAGDQHGFTVTRWRRTFCLRITEVNAAQQTVQYLFWEGPGFERC